VVGEPTLLLADEPTGSLDSKSGVVVLDILKELNRSGTTVVVITHDQELADGLPRQVRIRDGRIIADTSSAAKTLAEAGTDS